MLVRLLLLTTTFLIISACLFGSINGTYAQSKYSPFYVNETEIAERNTINYETFSSPQYGFSIDYIKDANIEDNLDVEKASLMYTGIEGPQIVFRGGGSLPQFLTLQFSSFNIYLNDSINMDRYIYRDLYGSHSGRGTDFETKVLDSGTALNVTGLPGKSIKYVLPGLSLMKEAVYFNDGINTYQIEFAADESQYKPEIFDHIVSSFKFIPIVADMDDGDEGGSSGNNEEEDDSDSSNEENKEDDSDSSNEENKEDDSDSSNEENKEDDDNNDDEENSENDTN